jgi:DNA-directed RNA polymerase subunit M/transcription elongation factor TFIIS
MDIINDIVNNKTLYANSISETNKISFLTDNIKQVPVQTIMKLEENIDRGKTINEFANLTKDIMIAFKLEAGIFEFTLIYCTTKNYIENIYPSVYYDKVNELMQNLDPNNKVNNQTLYKAIQNNMNPQTVAFIRPQDLHPERWKDIIKKITLKEDKKKNMAVTDLYQCWKCKERKCTVMELQTRSADENITKFITCTVCYTVMKKF